MLDQLGVSVADLLRMAAQIHILPRFGHLSDSDITIKTSATDLVTCADREAEIWLTPRLRELVDAPVIGEEACADQPEVRLQAGAACAWTIDPVDGTNNFVKVRDRFCSMVALLKDGIPVRSWIWLPLQQHLYYASAGNGAFFCDNGAVPRRLELAPRAWSVDELQGAASVRDIDEPEKSRLRDILRAMPGRWFPGSVGVLAGGIAAGEQHFLMHGSCTPWDHAPVDLLCREAGAYTAMVASGEAYHAGDNAAFMITPDAESWQMLRDHLWPDGTGF